MGNTFSQAWPPALTFTEEEVTNQAGKVFVITGSTAGVGKELAQILYSRNTKVYVAARSTEKASTMIAHTQAKHPESEGELIFLYLDLADLNQVKNSANEFLSKEQRLDVLWNNAAVMAPPEGSVTKQGYELQLGTNALGPFLFTKLLTPLLCQTAKSTGSVRVIWVSSSAAELQSPNGGLDMSNLDYGSDKSTHHKYAVSKVGNILHCKEYAKRHQEDGIISVCLNPGNLRTELSSNLGFWLTMLTKILVHPPIYGAYTELFAGLSPEITVEKTGVWVIPWGRFAPLRDDLEQAAKTEAEGGKGTAEKFWIWSEEQVKLYL
ncbi:short-chain alcohol dehydrogenase [Coniosporium apollinis]|uniref:Short-chain alcohol dehydrogenase n=1 Tax=Coniosporium apollinis TaxID=61459 RepID=A0ABQ9NT51_9PEZI|nr:short-chain alcohol dehydrogenase [Coniosporium apollinis]